MWQLINKNNLTYARNQKYLTEMSEQLCKFSWQKKSVLLGNITQDDVTDEIYSFLFVSFTPLINRNTYKNGKIYSVATIIVPKLKIH